MARIDGHHFEWAIIADFDCVKRHWSSAGPPPSVHPSTISISISYLNLFYLFINNNQNGHLKLIKPLIFYKKIKLKEHLIYILYKNIIIPSLLLKITTIVTANFYIYINKNSVKLLTFFKLIKITSIILK